MKRFALLLAVITIYSLAYSKDNSDTIYIELDTLKKEIQTQRTEIQELRNELAGQSGKVDMITNVSNKAIDTSSNILSTLSIWVTVFGITLTLCGVVLPLYISWSTHKKLKEIKRLKKSVIEIEGSILRGHWERAKRPVQIPDIIWPVIWGIRYAWWIFRYKRTEAVEQILNELAPFINRLIPSMGSTIENNYSDVIDYLEQMSKSKEPKIGKKAGELLMELQQNATTQS